MQNINSIYNVISIDFGNVIHKKIINNTDDISTDIYISEISKYENK